MSDLEKCFGHDWDDWDKDNNLSVTQCQACYITMEEYVAELEAELTELQEERDYLSGVTAEGINIAMQKVNTELEQQLAELWSVAIRAKVLLDDATYHDGRYDQHTGAGWQKEAYQVSKLLEHPA